MSTHETLGLMLVRQGVISRAQLYDALRLQRQNNRLLGTCLLSLGYLTADRLLQILSSQLQVPVLPPGSLKWASSAAVDLVPAELALGLRIVPYSFDGQMLGVAVADGRVLEHLHDVAKAANAAVGAYVALEMEIEAALAKLYGKPPDNGPLPGRPRPMRVDTGELSADAPPDVPPAAAPPAAPAPAAPRQGLPGGSAQLPAMVSQDLHEDDGAEATVVLGPKRSGAGVTSGRPVPRPKPPTVAAGQPVPKAPRAAAGPPPPSAPTPGVPQPQAPLIPQAFPPGAAPTPAPQVPSAQTLAPTPNAPPPRPPSGANAPPPRAQSGANAPPPRAQSGANAPASRAQSGANAPVSRAQSDAASPRAQTGSGMGRPPTPSGPIEVQRRTPSGRPRPRTPTGPTHQAPLRTGLGAPLERLGLYAAVDQLYGTPDSDVIGQCVGRAMLDYFERVLVLTLRKRQLAIVAYGGCRPDRASIALEAIPEVVSGLGRRKISYGPQDQDTRGVELCDIFGIGDAATCLIAPIDSESQVRLIVYADNGPISEVYDDLHDVELLLKEAETALSMLGEE